ncbi:MAG: hypothetical protein J0L92_31800 [Deltaproteobacteria bacterium]|nr:hypothetical protein [Deltaproteobacteria bacterium]
MKTRPRALALTTSMLLSWTLGCGGTERLPAREPPVSPTSTSTPPTTSTAVTECTTDDACMIGTPRDCCTSSCPEDRVPWTRAAWAEYQRECARTSCETSETLACRGVELPEVVAACVSGRCELVARP